MNLLEQLEELDSAESFLNLFQIEYDPEIIRHRRVPLLQMYRKNLSLYEEPIQ